MGATCSACCCNDRRESDVVLGDEDAGALQQKLIDASDYDHEGGDNGTMLTDDSRGNPYSHSDSRLKASWPRPAATPTSAYEDYEVSHDDDDDSDTDQSGYCDRSDTTSEHDSRHSSSAGNSLSGQLAWNLREAGGGGSFVASSTLVDGGDDEESSGMGSAMRSNRTLSTAQSVRSSAASDSYASTRELPTYESLLFADDAAANSHDSVDNDDDDDQGDGDSNSASTSSDRQSSLSFAESSSAIECAVRHRKQSY